MCLRALSGSHAPAFLSDPPVISCPVLVQDHNLELVCMGCVSGKHTIEDILREPGLDSLEETDWGWAGEKPVTREHIIPPHASHLPIWFCFYLWCSAGLSKLPLSH